jgi:hypothetical protein
MDLDGDSLFGHFRVSRYDTMSLYQPDDMNFSSILFGPVSSFNSFRFVSSSPSCKQLISRALKFDSAKILARPCPFINLVGLTSRSNYWILASHRPLFPSLSGCTNISFTEPVDMYAIIFECSTYVLTAFNDFTMAYTCFYIISYFSSESLRLLLKNVIGCSNPSSFFCRSTAVIVCLEENEKIRKSFR